MKVLWLCNIVLPELCDEFGFKRVERGGWLPGMWNELVRISNLEMGICVPIRDKSRMRDGKLKNYRYFSFHMINSQKDLSEQEKRFQEILKYFQPDIVHVWGTEYLHSYAMVQAAKEYGCISNVAVNIQGLVSVCALHYKYGLPEDLLRVKTVGNSIDEDIMDFKQRGEYESAVLKCVDHVVGRTDWDRGCSQQINPNLKYHFCPEILREEFYVNKRKWDAKECEKHSIFISQAGYPLKGIHLILEALAGLFEKYSDLQVYIAGGNLWDSDMPYAGYVKEKIEEYRLERVIHFIGMCTAAEMYQHYLRANVFVSASTIENSSNSVCEAMRVGIPVVSSYVGGISTLIAHGQSGLLYPLQESYMMRYYVDRIFQDDNLALFLSRNAKERAEELNNKNRAVKSILQIYKTISGKEI